ncbi:cyclic-phosphate processing receiver domain-containing protein [Streptomyces sp. NPDC020707]|uniref:cyclic-phosphate processing receiver domain-containing protein n=1 Tax=Streptomyces TaxID=1883 RepID=UPI0028D41909|nr:cyclic-phosphate processing receiver domain-containing protein [Streptomyces sp. DSM 40484]
MACRVPATTSAVNPLGLRPTSVRRSHNGPRFRADIREARRTRGGDADALACTRPGPPAQREAGNAPPGSRTQRVTGAADLFIDELWLDHDLGGDDSIMPVVTLLEEAGFQGVPFQIGTVYVHSANPIGAETVVRSLSHWNHHVRRAVAQ